MSSEVLAPCPFCGTAVDDPAHPCWEIEGAGGVALECGKCGAGWPKMSREIAQSFSSEGEAAAFWNRRAGPRIPAAPTSPLMRAMVERRRAARGVAAIRQIEGLRTALVPHLDALPPGPWKTWTSCSFRRIGGPGGHDGDVLHAYNQRGDGHPDLSWTEEQCDAICAIVNTLRSAFTPDAEETNDAGL